MNIENYYMESKIIDNIKKFFTSKIDYFKYNSIRRENYVMEKNEYILKKFNKFHNTITGKTLTLTNQITFKIEIEPEGFYYSNDKYNIYAFGINQEDAENNLLDEFLIQYNAYALEKDENLDHNAQTLKRDLLSIYGEFL